MIARATVDKVTEDTVIKPAAKAKTAGGAEAKAHPGSKDAAAAAIHKIDAAAAEAPEEHTQIEHRITNREATATIAEIEAAVEVPDIRETDTEATVEIEMEVEAEVEDVDEVESETQLKTTDTTMAQTPLIEITIRQRK